MGLQSAGKFLENEVKTKNSPTDCSSLLLAVPRLLALNYIVKLLFLFFFFIRLCEYIHQLRKFFNVLNPCLTPLISFKLRLKSCKSFSVKSNFYYVISMLLVVVSESVIDFINLTFQVC